jgi:hypothetical protein
LDKLNYFNIKERNGGRGRVLMIGQKIMRDGEGRNKRKA